MSLPFAKSSAVADTSSRPARACAGPWLRWNKKFWRQFALSLTATPDGVLLARKAAAMSPHDVVDIVRPRLQMKKVGHCGTLDPIATGLLLLPLGRGTKIQDLLMSEAKEYAGTMVLGISTDT